MSFLKDLKSDLSQAVNEMMSDDEIKVAKNDVGNIAKSDTKGDAKSNVNVKSSVKNDTKSASKEIADIFDPISEDDRINTLDDADDVIGGIEEILSLNENTETDGDDDMTNENYDDLLEDKATMPARPVVPEDEVAEITASTTIKGDIDTTGSINVYGKVIGDINCVGKISVTGTIVGTSKASEIFANNAKIEGDVVSEGSVKIGNGTVIVGNVTANSAVIGGAVKGDIDVHGPVIVDATAVIQGNIKSRSVQINNGAAIEGFCSQCYADIDYEALFDKTFASK